MKGFCLGQNLLHLSPPRKACLQISDPLGVRGNSVTQNTEIFAVILAVILVAATIRTRTANKPFHEAILEAGAAISVLVAVAVFLSDELAHRLEKNEQVTLNGHITDTAGVAIAGARISVRNIQTDEARVVTSNGDGNYMIVDLAQGTYTLQVTARGFRTFERLAVNLDDIITSIIAMQPAAPPKGIRLAGVEWAGRR